MSVFGGDAAESVAGFFKALALEQLLDRHRLREVVALRVREARAHAGRGLLGRLDALGDGLDPELARDRDQRGDQPLAFPGAVSRPVTKRRSNFR